MSNKVTVKFQQIVERTLVLPEYFTVRALKEQLKGIGYMFEGEIKVYIVHAGSSYAVEANDNYYITNGDKVYIYVKDSTDAVAAMEEAEQKEAEEAWEDMYIEEKHISIRFFA